MDRLAEYNIGYGLHFPPAHTLSYIKKRYAPKIGSLSETERAGDKIVSLPLFPDMRQEDVQYVCAAIKEIVNYA
jgi:dTDP-4-amino-4,6-dideoxygalactose transaminase